MRLPLLQAPAPQGDSWPDAGACGWFERLLVWPGPDWRAGAGCLAIPSGRRAGLRAPVDGPFRRHHPGPELRALRKRALKQGRRRLGLWLCGGVAR